MVKSIHMKTCSVEGCSNNVFSKGFCKFHVPKKPLSKSKGFKKKDIDNIMISAINEQRKRDDFFRMIWTLRSHKSEVSGALLGRTLNSMFFHHILPKRNYPQAEFDPDNIILLTPEEHASVELDIYKYEEVNIRREKLKQKYNII